MVFRVFLERSVRLKEAAKIGAYSLVAAIQDADRAGLGPEELEEAWSIRLPPLG